MTRPTAERFEGLVRTLHAPVFRSARRMCADDSAAADVVQEVFTSVWAGKVRLDRAENERAMLCWLAARLAANATRAAKRRARHEETAMQRSAETTLPDPSDQTANDDLRRTAATLVGELPPDLRIPLLMRHQDDLTLAAIGAALSLPTSTVHDRIQQALERLRARLVDRRHAIALGALPRVVADLDVPPAPSGLEARLLALPSALPVAASAVKGFAMLAAGIVVWVGIALAANGLRADPEVAGPTVLASAAADAPQDPPATGGAATERKPAEVLQPTAPAVAAKPAPAVVATFTGSVRDAEAWPVAGANVRVVAGGGYKPFAVGAPATTDGKGAFTVHVVSSWLQPRAVRLVVEENGRQLLATGDLVVPRPADAQPLELVLPPSAGTATSRFELAVDVRDEAGLVLPDVPVHLYGASEPRPRPEWAQSEGSGKTGANGTAVLPGRGLGAKWLFVDGRPLARESSFTRIAVDKAGPMPVRVVLAKGTEMVVEVKSVTGRTFDWGKPWLIDERTGLRLDGDADGGVFRFRGLGDGPYTVMAAGDGDCSLAARKSVHATASPVVLTLKDRTDERDVGDHLAELHGELVDAETGEVIEFGPFAIDTMPVIADGSSLVSDCIEPPAPAQRSAPAGKHRRFHETGLDAGRWALVVSVPGYATTSTVFDLKVGEVRTGLRIALHRQAVVRGRVVDAAGRGVKGAMLFAIGTGPLADRLLDGWREVVDRTRDPGSRDVSFTPVSGWSGDGGTFVVDQIPPGVELRLVARHDDHGLVVVPLPNLRAGDTIADFAVRLPR